MDDNCYFCVCVCVYGGPLDHLSFAYIYEKEPLEQPLSRCCFLYISSFLFLLLLFFFIYATYVYNTAFGSSTPLSLSSNSSLRIFETVFFFFFEGYLKAPIGAQNSQCVWIFCMASRIFNYNFEVHELRIHTFFDKKKTTSCVFFLKTLFQESFTIIFSGSLSLCVYTYKQSIPPQVLALVVVK